MGLSARMLRALGWCWLIVGVMAVPFVVIAAAEGAGAAARGFSVSALMGVFAGGVALAATRSATGKAGPPVALRMALYGWLSTPLFAAAPLVAAADGLMPGLFESYSALTTTGATVLDPDTQPRAILLWRASLQWIGGFATLVLAATVFAALEAKDANLRRSTLLTVTPDNLFLNFGPAARRLGGVYGLVTAVAILLLSLTSLDAFDAICLAFSAISTGGMTPTSAPLGSWVPVPAQIILVVTCLMGAWNIALQYELLSRGRAVRLTGDLRAMVSTCAAIGLGAAVLFGPSAAYEATLDAVFALTTTGFGLSPAPVLPTVLLLSLAVIGGSALSTSGGMKITRVIVLLRRAAGELSVLAHPSAATYTRFAGRHIPDSALFSVWVVALVFPAAIGAFTIFLGLVGVDFHAAWQIAAAMLSNAGPVAAVDYASLPAAGHGIAILAMITGRLEILAAAAAVFVILVRE
jgi:trk system potassium uptake protein